MSKISFTILFLLPLFSLAKNSENKESIRRTIKDNLSFIKTCYTEGSKTNSQLKGKVVLRWTIDDSGSVKNAKIYKSTLNNSMVEDCMLDSFNKIKFSPAPTGTTEVVDYPFYFSPNK